MIAQANELKRWSILNLENGKISEVTHSEFKNLLDSNAIRVSGEFIFSNIRGNTCKIWIDAKFKEEYLK